VGCFFVGSLCKIRNNWGISAIDPGTVGEEMRLSEATVIVGDDG
jgi:hypothetical protein